MKQNRRTFLESSAKIAVAASISSGFPNILRAGQMGPAPSDQIGIALIGCRSRGFHVLTQHLDLDGVNCLALCDVDENVLRERAKEIEEKYGQKPSLYKDFRKLLEQKDIDAVIIGTPDHWHCLQTVYACEAGKDVYVEKPLTNSIGESQIIVEVARRTGRLVQVGQQQRSGKVWNDAMAYMKSGKLGHIHKTDIWANFNYGLGPEKQADAPVPAGLDYDLWLGPAPKKPFNPARLHGNWRHFWDYGGGLMTDFGAHLIDMALWVKDITTPPETVLAYGSRLDRPDLAKETFDTMTVVYPIGDYTIQWESSAGKQTGPYNRNYGLAFLGDKGTLVIDRRGWEVIPEWDGEAKAPKVEAFTSEPQSGGHDLHARDFVDCLRNRREPVCPPEIGCNVALYAHMANIAVRTGDYKLEWDQEKGKFKNSRAANRLITPEYRSPWKLPK